MAKILTSEYIMELVAPQLEDMSDDAFFSFCLQNKHLKIERDETRQIIFMPPEGNNTAAMNVNIATDLTIWNRIKSSGVTFGSSAGFYLPDTSMRSPDAAWMSMQKWNSLSIEERKSFPHVAPDFIVELMSPSENQKRCQNENA